MTTPSDDSPWVRRALRAAVAFEAVCSGCCIGHGYYAVISGMPWIALLAAACAVLCGWAALDISEELHDLR